MVFTSKVVSIVVLFTVSSVFGVLPCFIIRCLASKKRKGRKYKTFMGLLNSLAGGVFLGVSLLGLLPEALEQTEQYLNRANIDTDYPISQIIMACGLMMILYLEHAIGMAFTKYRTKPTEAKQKQKGVVLNRTKYTGEPVMCNEVELVDNETDLDSSNTVILKKEAIQDEINDSEIRNVSKLRSIMLIFALSFHTIFDGLALGLQTSDSTIWNLLLALCLHKAVVSASLGFHMEEKFASVKNIVICMLFFSLISPIGVGIGMATTTGNENKQSQMGASAILQSIATGTFFYVTFFEILQKELGKEHNVLKVFVTNIGLAIIGGLKYLEGSE